VNFSQLCGIALNENSAVSRITLNSDKRKGLTKMTEFAIICQQASKAYLRVALLSSAKTYYLQITDAFCSIFSGRSAFLRLRRNYES